MRVRESPKVPTAHIVDRQGALALVDDAGHAICSIVYNPASAASRQQACGRLMREAVALGYRLGPSSLRVGPSPPPEDHPRGKVSSKITGN